jgi:hypothetical protein
MAAPVRGNGNEDKRELGESSGGKPKQPTINEIKNYWFIESKSITNKCNLQKKITLKGYFEKNN